jgi:hypothetical protein
MRPVCINCDQSRADRVHGIGDIAAVGLRLVEQAGMRACRPSATASSVMISLRRALRWHCA